MEIQEFLGKLQKVKRAPAPQGKNIAGQWNCQCPGHDDKTASLTIGQSTDGRIVMKCFAGCSTEQIISALRLSMKDIAPNNGNTPQCTVFDLAQAKKIPEKLLLEYGCEQVNGYVRITYRDADGKLCARQRKRWGLSGNSCSAWEPGSGSPQPYGLWRLGNPEYLVLVEGESDTWTLWMHGFPAIGIPGAEMAGKLSAEHIPASVKEIFVVKEPDRGGEKFFVGAKKRLAEIGFSGEVFVIDMAQSGHKDPSAWNCANPEKFKEEFISAIEKLHKPDQDNKKPKFKTLLDITKSQYPPHMWCIEGILPVGLSILAGPPKLGKSLMCLQLALQAANVRFQSELVSVSPSDTLDETLYLALEDSERRIQSRLLDMIGDQETSGIERIKIATNWAKGDQAVIDVREHINEYPATRLVIVDTLVKVRGKEDARRRLYDLDADATSGWQKLAIEKNIAIVIVHHTRKSDAEDAIDKVSGSTGLTGVCDAILVASRARCQGNAVLSITGRDIEERELAMEFCYPAWKILGDAKNISQNAATRKIQDTLLGLGGKGTPRDIYKVLSAGDPELKENTIRQACKRALQRGEISFLGMGVYSLIPTEDIIK